MRKHVHKNPNLWILRVECTHDERRLVIERLKLNIKHFEQRGERAARYVDGKPVDAASRFTSSSMRDDEGESIPDREFEEPDSKARFVCRDCSGPHARPLDVTLTWPKLDAFVAPLFINRATLWPTAPPRIELSHLVDWAAGTN